MHVLWLMSEDIESEKRAVVLLWVCGMTFHTSKYFTHKSLTADPYKKIKWAPYKLKHTFLIVCFCQKIICDQNHQ